MLELQFENFKAAKTIITKAHILPLMKRGETILHLLPKFKKYAFNGKLQLTLTDDAKIQWLNKEYRGFNKPTDVLSFSYFSDEAFPGDDVVGEIVISIDTAKRQAKEHKKTVREEIQFLFAHGFLHVFGYDHEEMAERKIMFDLQDQIIGHNKWRSIADTEAEKTY